MNKILVVLSMFCAGFLTAVMCIEEYDAGGYKKAAYDEGYTNGIAKGVQDGHELGQGEPKSLKRVVGKNFTVLVCKEDYGRSPGAPSVVQLCITRSDAGFILFVELPWRHPRIDPGTGFVNEPTGWKVRME